MPTLPQKIDNDLVGAMKSADSARVGVLRLLKNSLKNEQIKVGHELESAEVLRVLQREAKQRQDSISAYQSGGREDLVAGEQAELEVIQEYLPERLGDEELTEIISTVINSLNAQGMAMMGQVMQRVMKQVGGNADGGRVSALVQKQLQARNGA